MLNADRVAQNIADRFGLDEPTEKMKIMIEEILIELTTNGEVVNQVDAEQRPITPGKIQ